MMKPNMCSLVVMAKGKFDHAMKQMRITFIWKHPNILGMYLTICYHGSIIIPPPISILYIFIILDAGIF